MEMNVHKRAISIFKEHNADFVTPIEHIADSEASSVSELVEDFNALLAALVEAGLMTPAEETEEEEEDNGGDAGGGTGEDAGGG